MRFDVNVEVEIDYKKILNSRGLGDSQTAALFLASEVKRFCDPYVPMQQGTLKNTAQVTKDSDGVEVLYNQPHAHYQYHGEVMAGEAPKHYTGKPLTYNDAPMRGKEWDKRMMADRKDDILRSFANFVGGEVE